MIILKTPKSTTSNESHHEHIKSLVEAQECIIKIAQDNQEQHSIHVIAKRLENNSYTTHFPINSYVLVNYETQKTSKLHTIKHCPYWVINHVGTVYTVEHLVTKVIRDFHVKLLTEYKYDENNINIYRVAKLDDEYADIVDVIDHRYIPPNSKKRSSLEFLLTWEDDRDPNWYQWNSSLGDNERIHDYLDKNELRKYIPIKYTFPNDHPEEIARRQKRKNDKDTITSTKRQRKGF